MPENMLIWIDLETTGLVPEEPTNNLILEIGAIATNVQLEVQSSFERCVYYSDFPPSMNDFVLAMHTRSSLLHDCQQFGANLSDAEKQFTRFLNEFAPNGNIIPHGNTIHFDMRFIRRWMPETMKYFHHRIIDISSIKEMMRIYYPGHVKDCKTEQHRALVDLQESIAEYKHYLKVLGFLGK